MAEREPKFQSKAQGFTHGMVSDANPRFQLKGSYRDAMNIRLINDDGETFTVENIEGNRLSVDLADYDVNNEIFFDEKNTDANQQPIGPGLVASPFHEQGTGPSLHNLEFTSNIVGSWNYKNELILIIVSSHGYRWTGTTAVATTPRVNRTKFLKIKFNNKFDVESVTDLGVCFSNQNDNYPDLNMKVDTEVRIEGIIENECITRIYWTDNTNKLRTLNINAEGLNQLSPDMLDLNPLVDASQPLISETTVGSLPVGMYQYVYKYISANGGESSFSPLSNLYHTTDKGTGQFMDMHGGPKDNLGSMGFEITINDLDDDYQNIELYSLLYEEQNVPPKVCLVGSQYIKGLTSAKFNHILWDNEIENGLETILIETNTFEVCKDIAIKDNILFAANLKQKKNMVSEKDWNVKVRRWRIGNNRFGTTSSHITTNDNQIKEYKSSGGVVSETSSAHTGADEGSPTSKWRSGRNYNAYRHHYAFKYLSDGKTLGAESWSYNTNELGGCRLTFGVKERIADKVGSEYANAPYVNASGAMTNIQTDNITSEDGTTLKTDNTNNIYTSTLNISGSKDPSVGNRKGYQRGEVYRFGVQTYDLNGAPGNVLWIGDIEMPRMADPIRMLRTHNEDGTVNTSFDFTSSSNDFESKNMLGCHPLVQDHRLDYIHGHMVPRCDVPWYTGRTPIKNLGGGAGYGDDTANAFTTLGTYLDADGNDLADQPKNSINSREYGKRLGWANTDHDWEEAGSDHTHYMFDLFVNFEFRIPENIRQKISGFRVVRAERREEDRMSIQQGLLNQCAKYGLKSDLKWGYNTNQKLSRQDNEDMFINEGFNPWKQWHRAGGSSGGPNLSDLKKLKTNTICPPYDLYLNGYLGLAEHSLLADFLGGRDQTTTEPGKIIPTSEVPLSGDNDHVGDNANSTSTKMYKDNVYARPESEGGAESWSDFSGSFGNNKRPGTRGTDYRHSSYFGWYTALQLPIDTDAATGYQGAPGNYGVATAQGIRATFIQGNMYTLDAPDSAFGVRPYSYRDGDKLICEAVLKLADDERFENTSNKPKGYNNMNYGKHITAGANNGVGRDGPTDLSDTESLRFAKKRQTLSKDKAGILIGKFHTWDPWAMADAHLYGGKTYADDGVSQQIDYLSGGVIKQARNTVNVRENTDIKAAKEIGDGETIGNSEFYYKTSDFKGFSNHTLGFCLGAVTSWDGIPSNPIGKKQELSILKFGCISKYLTYQDSWVDNDGTNSKVLADPDKDYTYDTVSTLQMGLRTIWMQISTTWFTVPDFGAIIQNKSWNSRDNTGTLKSGSGANAELNIWKGSRNSRNSLIPYSLLCSIKRSNIPYGGTRNAAIMATRYIPCGNFHPVNNTDEYHLSQVFGGDTFINLYSHQKTSTPYPKYSYARWKVFPVESFVNTDMRSGLHLGAGDTELGEDQDVPPYSNDWLYNNIYSQENNIKSSIMVDEKTTCDNLDLPYEIAFSNTKIAGEPGDSFRTFPIDNFHDMEGEYGEINRIIKFKNELYVVQDSAFAKLLVNPLSVLTADDGTGIFTGTGDTVESHQYISTKYGSKYKNSVITSEDALYYVDGTYAKILRYDTEKLVSLGDTLGQRSRIKEYILNGEDINSIEKEGRNFKADNPLNFLGVHSAFDHMNKDVLFTFLDHRLEYPTERSDHKRNTLVYNESIKGFTTTYSIHPPAWINIGAKLLTSEIGIGVKTHMDTGGYTTDVTGSGVTHPSPDATIAADFTWTRPLKLWLWDDHENNLKCHFYDLELDNKAHPMESYIEKVVADAAEETKVFDNAKIIINYTEPMFQMLNPIGFSVSWETDTTPPALPATENTNFLSELWDSPSQGTIMYKYLEGMLRLPLRVEDSTIGRARGTYLKIKFSAQTLGKFNIFAIMSTHRKSYK